MAGKILARIIAICFCLASVSGIRYTEDDFYIGQGVSDVVFNCADSASITVKYWNVCDLKIRISTCPMAALSRRFASDTNEDRYRLALEANKNRIIKLDQGIVQSAAASNTFLQLYTRSGNPKLRNIRRICCQTAVPSCTDAQLTKTCPGNPKFKQNSYNEIIFMGCKIAADELVNEG